MWFTKPPKEKWLYNLLRQKGIWPQPDLFIYILYISKNLRCPLKKMYLCILQSKFLFDKYSTRVNSYISVAIMHMVTIYWLSTKARINGEWQIVVKPRFWRKSRFYISFMKNNNLYNLSEFVRFWPTSARQILDIVPKVQHKIVLRTVQNCRFIYQERETKTKQEPILSSWRDDRLPKLTVYISLHEYTYNNWI